MKFTENDIRPNVFKSAMEEALQKDLDSLVPKKASFVMVSCPACGSWNNHFAFEKYSFRFVCCNQCDTIYMNPRATQEILRDFYANSALYDYWNRYVFPASKEVRRKKIFKLRVKRILEICESYNVAMHCLIEVGAGYGIFCEEMKKRGRFKHIIAVEPNAELAESCSSVGVEVINDSIENIHSLKISPNLIACFEVIEHLFSPEAFLLHCKRLIEPGAIIVFTCPNYKGFDIESLAEKSGNIDAEHINMFNPNSLSLLLNRCGFKVLELTTPGELDAEILRNKVLNGEYSLSEQPFLRTVLIDRWEELGQPFQEFLKQYNLSSHLWVVAQKTS